MKNTQLICFLSLFALPLTAMKDPQLIDLQKKIPTIVLDIKYATEDNFTHKVVYPIAKAYLVKGAAQALCEVQSELEKEGLGLKVFDGYRPLSVQEKFWQLVPDERYVADPKKGSRHNRGCAVDCTLICLKDGKELEMPTPFDDFTEKAHRDYMNIPAEVRTNREKLEAIMNKHGFMGLPTEWWHFDYQGWEHYALLDKNFDELEAQ
jgi:D-alanyl-D-alanine dipeptidase